MSIKSLANVPERICNH